MTDLTPKQTAAADQFYAATTQAPDGKIRVIDEMDLARTGPTWRFYPDKVLVELETVTPGDGRVWNPDTWLWEAPS